MLSGYAGGNPNLNPICGKKATAHCKFSVTGPIPLISLSSCSHFVDGGKTVTVALTDRCTGCAEWDLDFSPSAFDQLADEDIGRLHGMTWHFDN